MKIEKINENQIKCTLSKSDLSSRQIKVSELAYGTEKAKMLFRDMMQQAAVEFGFHAEDLPLMIEAIPLPGDSIILIITKVEEPEELDTRFSNFSPDDEEDEEDMQDEDPYEELDSEYLDDMEELIDDVLDNPSTSIYDLFQQVKSRLNEISSGREFIPLSEIIDAARKTAREKALPPPEQNMTCIFSFPDLESLICAAGYIGTSYHGHNSLYHSEQEKRYYLIMDNSSHTIPEFAIICNMVSEFGKAEEFSPVSEAYYKEHMRVILPEDALQKLQLIYTGGKNNGKD